MPTSTSSSFSPERQSPGFEAIYRAGMESAIVLDRAHRETLEVTGEDRESFLQNMLSADVKTLALGEGRHAAFLTHKGKLVADFIVFRDDRRFFLDVEEPRADPLRTALDRYIISEDVTIVRRSDESAISIEGPEASARLAAVFHETPALDELPHLGFVGVAHSSEAQLRIVARRRDPSPRFDLSGSSAAVEELARALVEAGAMRATESVREVRRIESGRPRFGVDVTEDHMPLEAGLDEAISFDKGCYIGQEYVVRLAHRGHLNKRLTGLTIEGRDIPDAGAEVTAGGGAPVGQVSSAAFSPTLGRAIALAWVKRGAFEPGTAVRIGTARAVVTALPFLPASAPSTSS